jgi:hypothetical protein
MKKALQLLFASLILVSQACGDPAEPMAPDEAPAPVRPDAGAPVPAPKPRATCPRSWFDIPHGSACSERGQFCEWDDFKTVSAICDGRFWRVVEREKGCPTQSPGGSCGQFRGACGYIVEAEYPGGTAKDYCLKECFCDGGSWRCEDTCRCPGPKTEDPLDSYGESQHVELEGACLHDQMSCGYDYKVGNWSVSASDTDVRQPCQTSFVCSNGKWTHSTSCTCPVFPEGKTSFSYACRSPSSLVCTFPPAYPDEPARSCRCNGSAWSCK